MRHEKTIVQTATGADNFKIFVGALKEAGLAEYLNGDGPFTVFAPTDEAFSRLPGGTMEALMKDRAKLTSILNYHIVPQMFMAVDMVTTKSVKTIQGGVLKFDTCEGFKVNGAHVVTNDMECSNGIIHAIDTVLMPQ